MLNLMITLFYYNNIRMHRPGFDSNAALNYGLALQIINPPASCEAGGFMVDKVYLILLSQV